MVQAIVRKGSPGQRSENTGVGFVKQVGYKPEVKQRELMDKQSGKSKEEEVMGEGIGESGMEELVPE